MIDFEEELKHFSPSTDIGDVEKQINREDLTDMTDIMLQMLAAVNE